jgi:hypothetical protein
VYPVKETLKAGLRFAERVRVRHGLPSLLRKMNPPPPEPKEYSIPRRGGSVVSVIVFGE